MRNPDTPSHSLVRRRRFAALLLLAFGGVAGCSANHPSSGSPAPGAPETAPVVAPSTSESTAGSIPDGDAPIEPGTYRIPRSAWSVTDFTVTFPEGWTVQYGHVYASNQDSDEEFGFYAVVVDGIWADACAGSNSGDPIEVGPTVDDLTEALLEQPGPTASGPVTTTLGGHPATRIDLTVPKAFDLEPCNASGIGLQIWYSEPADKNFILTADSIASAYILDVDGKRQVFLTQHGATTSDDDLTELQAVLDSIRIKS